MMKPIIINNLEFAAKHEHVSGDLRLVECQRLLAETAEKNDPGVRIIYSLTGSNNKTTAPSLALKINAALNVICQRCLEPMPIELALAFHYVISDLEPATEEADDTDWLPASLHMNLNELIEDELLLALPIAPTHAYQCVVQQLQSGQPANPFAVLKDRLKK